MRLSTKVFKEYAKDIIEALYDGGDSEYYSWVEDISDKDYNALAERVAESLDNDEELWEALYNDTIYFIDTDDWVVNARKEKKDD